MGFTASKERAKAKISELIEKYIFIKKFGKEKKYTEPNVRIKFIEPFLEAMGWDVRGDIDIVEAEEKTLTGPADFALKVNGRMKIAFEVKKFTEDLDGYRETRKGRESYVEQAIRYAYHKNADWAVLTNFKELRVYNVRWDVKTVEERLLSPFPLKYGEYLENFDKLWLLSKESVVSGRLDEWIKKGLRSPIDREILSDLLKCRKLLTDDIHKHNKDLTSEELRGCVQKILNRIVVIRVAEDRGIIPAESLWVKLDTWKRTRISDAALFIRDLKEFFRQFDDVYNSKLFEEHKCENLRISNEVLGDIINTLYEKYNFDLIGADILGSIYEDYIGHMLKEVGEEVKIVKEHRKRKETGIYYTPTCVVEYIVRNTLGELLKDKTPEEVQRIKVLDITCGSGSFLNKALDVFKKYHRQRQKEIKKEAGKTGKITPFLSRIPADREILIQNIYGVDLDEQAAEIASVNLMLKALKRDERLPLILGENIRVGNSLISGTEEELKRYFKKPKEKKPFNWEAEFPQIFEQGGFDIIIGNPPYIENRSIDPTEKKYLNDVYDTTVGQYDYLVPFVEKASILLKNEGIFGFIVSNKFMATDFGIALRKKLIEELKLEQLIDVSHFRVFRDAAVYPVILIFKKSKSTEKDYVLVSTPREEEFEKGIVKKNKIPIQFFKQIPGYILSTLLTEKKMNLLQRVWKHPTINPKDVACGVAQIGSSKKIVQFDEISQKQQKGYTPMLQGNDIDRYYVAHTNKGLPLDIISGEKTKDFNKRKILVPGMVKRLYAALDEVGCACGRIYYITEDAVKYDLKYLLALFNSNLWAFIYETIYGAVHLQGDYIRVNSPYLGVLPIYPVTNKEQEQIIELVDKMIHLNKQFNEINTDFGRHLTEPILNYVNFKNYYDKLSIDDKEALDKSSRGVIKKLKVEERNDWLVFKVDYTVKKKKKEMQKFSDAEVLRCKFEDELLRKFLFYTIENYKKSLGTGNLLDKILKIKIPRFDKDPDKNTQIIDKMMGGYLKAVKEKERLEGEIKKTDDQINRKVYGLYGLTQEEISIIESNLLGT